MTTQVIPLVAIPNQELSVVLGGNRYTITIKAIDAAGSVAVTIARDSVVVVDGWRALSGVPLLPFPYMEQGAGNFMLVTLDDEIPSWQNFTTTCELVWTSQAELDTYRDV